MIRIVILVVAVGSGALAGWLALADRAPAPAPAVVSTTSTVAAPAVEMTDVLVATAELAQGKPLAAADMRWQPWPTAAVDASFVTPASRPDAMTALAGSVVRTQFQPGEPIREDKLAPMGSGFMSALLPPGKRAVAVRISAENTAGGFVLPNDRVDVIHTVSQPGTDQQPAASTSRAILSNIRVLAVDQSQSVDAANPQKVAVGRTATLELAANQVDTVTAAEASGTLSLALRSSADANEPTPLRPADRRQGAQVRVYRDGAMEVVNVSPHREGG